MADSLGNLDDAAVSLKQGLALQGKVSEPTKCQKRTWQLAVLCFARAQGQIDKDLNGSKAIDSESCAGNSQEDSI